MAAEVFRPQSVGRALRTAFVLGVLIVVALVAALAAVHQFSALTGDNTKDELSRYLDDNQHTTASPHGAGFSVSFPVPPDRETEQFSTGTATVAAQRDRSLVDDEVTFDAVWLDLTGAIPSDPNKILTVLVGAQLHELEGTAIGSSGKRKLGAAVARDVAMVSVDRSGEKHYTDVRIVVEGRRVWVLRVSSRIRRDAVFQRFISTFTLTG